VVLKFRLKKLLIADFEQGLVRYGSDEVFKGLVLGPEQRGHDRLFTCVFGDGIGLAGGSDRAHGLAVFIQAEDEHDVGLPIFPELEGVIVIGDRHPVVARLQGDLKRCISPQVVW